jgi:Tfp pilus assembly protein FimT
LVIASKLKYDRTGEGGLKDLLRKDLAFSTIELLVVLGIIGILAALTLPAASTAVKNYHLHSDASAIGGFLNVTRMKSAAQYAPYALDIDPTAKPPTFKIEQLANNTYNPLSPTAGSYASQSPPAFDQATGTQQTSSDSTVAACRPAGISVYPGAVTADPSTCTGAFQICFNTRGAPVLCAAAGASAGTPLTNGGLAVYLTGATGLTDAVSIDVGGVAQVWSWSPSSSQWYLR